MQVTGASTAMQDYYALLAQQRQQQTAAAAAELPGSAQLAVENAAAANMQVQQIQTDTASQEVTPTLEVGDRPGILENRTAGSIGPSENSGNNAAEMMRILEAEAMGSVSAARTTEQTRGREGSFMNEVLKSFSDTGRAEAAGLNRQNFSDYMQSMLTRAYGV